MYLQAFWKSNKNNSSVSNLIEIDSWESAGIKLPNMYEGYNLTNLNLVTFSVEKGDINGPAYVVNYVDRNGDTQSSWILAADFDTCLYICKEVLGASQMISIGETKLTYKSEQS